MAEAFGRHTKGNGQIIIVGRNRTAADSIIAKLPQSSSHTRPHKFVQCDATLMRNVHAASSEILADHPKINFLVMSPGFMTTKGRDETEEGIDRKLAVHYYARWAFINDLMPALQKASEDGEEAKIFSVLGAGKGAEIGVEDLGLKKSYSGRKAGLAAPTYNDLMIEAFAERHPDLTFIHAFPGMVRTNILAASSTPLLKASSGILSLLTYPLSTAPEDCAEYMWHASLNHSKDAFRTGSKGENNRSYKYVNPVRKN